MDFEHSINTAIRKLRDALDDNAEQHQYIETLPRRGYRFIAPVSTAIAEAPISAPAVDDATLAPEPMLRSKPLFYALAFFGAALVAIGGFTVWKAVTRAPEALKVVHFRQLTKSALCSSP